jgi:hypothetical protein
MRGVSTTFKRELSYSFSFPLLQNKTPKENFKETLWEHAPLCDTVKNWVA